MICFRCNNSSFRFVRPPLYIQLRNDLKNKHSIILILRSSLKTNVFLLFSLCLFCYFLEISANVLFVSFSFCLNFGQHTSFYFCLFFFFIVSFFHFRHFSFLITEVQLQLRYLHQMISCLQSFSYAYAWTRTEVKINMSVFGLVMI